jgi:hypothetical protein
MSDALDRCGRVVALFSAAYFDRSRYTTEEWAAAVVHVAPVDRVARACGDAGDGLPGAVGLGQRIVVDEGNLDPGVAGGGRLGGEIFVLAARGQHVGGNQ